MLFGMLEQNNYFLVKLLEKGARHTTTILVRMCVIKLITDFIPGGMGEGALP